MIRRTKSASLDNRLAAYAAATTGVVAASAASTSEAVVIGNNDVIPFGINESVPIDLNGDGEIDFEIDHDRVDLNGTDLDFLQIDKNDQVGLTLPGTQFPDAGDPGTNETHEYLTDVGDNYPIALSLGDSIGPASPGKWEFQETDTYNSMTGTFRRSNRLIDEDNGQLDIDAGNTIETHTDTPNWLGLNGEVGYLGLRIDFNNSGGLQNYGWVGVRITNEDDATGEIVGFAYNDTPGAPISAGSLVPEPGTALMAICGAVAMGFAVLNRRWRGR